MGLARVLVTGALLAGRVVRVVGEGNITGSSAGSAFGDTADLKDCLRSEMMIRSEISSLESSSSGGPARCTRVDRRRTGEEAIAFRRVN